MFAKQKSVNKKCGDKKSIDESSTCFGCLHTHRINLWWCITIVYHDDAS